MAEKFEHHHESKPLQPEDEQFGDFNLKEFLLPPSDKYRDLIQEVADEAERAGSLEDGILVFLHLPEP